MTRPPPPFFPPLSFPLCASHFIEVQYLFDLEALGITPTFTPDQQALSNTIGSTQNGYQK